MGGFAGRCDALAVAVECQKKSGCLHFHFWAYIQRAHQHNSPREIAALLESELISSDDLKQFCKTLCCEEYPNTTLLQKEVDELERRWSQFSENDFRGEDSSVPTWGRCTAGRIAPMFWNDNGCSYGDLLQQEDAPRRTIVHDELTEDARRYQESFNDVLQENMKCVQHHIHKKCPKTGERRLPNACVSYTCKASCKHGFPQTEKMNLDELLPICKDLQKRKL